MKEIKEYEKEGYFTADVNISVEEWQEILSDSNLMTENYQDVLLKFYEEPDHKATCKHLGKKYNESHGRFNATIRQFGEAVQKRLNKFHIVNENGEFTYWIIPMEGKRTEEGFEWKLRAELVKAIEKSGWVESSDILYERFKNLLAYFVSHLDWVVNENKEFKGYEKYIQSIGSFKKTGQGYMGDAIQNQVQEWENYENKKIAINISNFSGGGYKSRSNYLNWISTGININAYWKENEIVSLFQELYIYDGVEKGKRIDLNCKKTIDELGLFEEGVTEGLIEFYNKYETALKNHNKENEKMRLKNELAEYILLLKANKNLILTGAPGTGKTYLAKKMAKQLIFGEAMSDAEMIDEESKVFEKHFSFVQFHPSYDYTDFVEGLRPTAPDANGNIGFELRNGVFKEFCIRATKNVQNQAKDNFEEVWEEFLEEMRGNIAKGKLTAIGKWEFGLSSRDSLKYSSTDTPSQYSFTLTKNNIYAAYQGKQARPSGAFQKDMEDVVHYLLDNFKLLPYKNESKQQTTSDKPYVFVIDEINRGEISKIFGELFFSIDPGYRGRKGAVKTQYANLQEGETIFDLDLGEGWFYIPENVYIIGTMNDIDRSVESMDFAMRRRFAWREIKASDRLQMLNEVIPNQAEEAKNRLRNLNDAIEKIQGLNAAYHIGPAYFMKLKNYEEKHFENLWNHHIEGVLTEYLRGYPNADEEINKLKKAYNMQKEEPQNQG